MKHSPSLQRAAMLICLAAIYYVAAKVGLQFAFVNTSVTTIWPPAGNGETVEALLNAADVALYETKERRKSKPSGLAP